MKFIKLFIISILFATVEDEQDKLLTFRANSNKIIRIIIFLSLIVNTISAQLVDSSQFKSWLDENSFELTNQDSAGYDQLLGILENKSVVGLGECIHGSKTINNHRINLSKQLVQKKNFNTVAMEMSFNTGLRINRYLETGKGDLKQFISQSHFFCNSKELLEFLQWMRKQNEANSSQLSFYGFDIQSNIDIIDDLKIYFANVDKSTVADAESLYKILNENEMGNFGEYKKELQDSTFSLVNKLKEKLEKNRKKYVLKEGFAEYEYAAMRCKVVTKYLQMLSSGYSQSLRIRDESNAELISWIKDFEGENSKLILFAHNGHLGKSQRFTPRVRTLSVEGFYEDYPQELITGYWLKEKFQDKYFFIGTQFGKGNFMGFDPQTKKLSKLYVDSPEQNSFPGLLGMSSKQNYYIGFNFTKATPRPIVNYICSLQSFYEIGAAYDFKYSKARLIDYFDGIIFVNQIEESELFREEK